MSLFTAFGISASGLTVQKERLQVSSENLANSSSTRTPDGGPYQRRAIVIASKPVSFEENLANQLKPAQVQMAQVLGISKTDTPPKMIFDPQHPDANEQGYVAMPDINVTQEMIDILSASKAYEANITVLNAGKSMILRTLEIGSV